MSTLILLFRSRTAARPPLYTADCASSAGMISFPLGVKRLFFGVVHEVDVV